MGITTSTGNKSIDVSSSNKSTSVGGKGIVTTITEGINEAIDNTDYILDSNKSDIDFMDIEPDIPEGGFSNTEYNDEDNINVNQLSKIMVEFQNELTKDGEEKVYYDIFAELVQGKKLGDILDENGHVKDSSSFSDADLAKIQELINKNNLNISVDEYLKRFDNSVKKCSEEGEASVTLTHISNDMLNNVIEEVVSTDSSYDAFVLKNPDNGNYMIVNSCTNAKSTDDLLAIAYAMSMQLTGSLELIDYVLGYMLPSMDADVLNDIKSSDLYMELTSGNKTAAKKIQEIYEKELKDNQDLIKKYIDQAKEEGTKVELQGYSLGGGIQLAAYSSLCVDNPELEDYISSVTVFNPYVSFCEENPLNMDKSADGGDGSAGPLIDYLANSDKLRIYSNEEDFVSTFNNCLPRLIDKYCFVNSQDLSEHADVQTITDIYGIVIGGGSNHGFGVIDYSCFEDGNITNPGNFFSIDESMATTIDEDSFIFHIWCEMEDMVEGGGFKYKVDYKKIIEKTLDIENVRDKVADNGAAAEALFNSLINYIEDNVGNYNYDDFTDAIADACWDAVLAGIKEKVESGNFPFAENVGDFVSFLANNVSKKESFKKGIKTFLNEQENMDTLFGAIDATLDGDNAKAKKYYNLLLDSLKLSMDGELMGDFFDAYDPFVTISAFDGISYLLTDYLKDQFIDSLRNTVNDLL